MDIFGRPADGGSFWLPLVTVTYRYLPLVTVGDWKRKDAEAQRRKREERGCWMMGSRGDARPPSVRLRMAAGERI